MLAEMSSGQVFLEDFGLTVWSRAGGDEGMGREPNISPGSVPTQILEPAGHSLSIALLPWCSGRLQMAEIWRNWFSLKTNLLLSSR